MSDNLLNLLAPLSMISFTTVNGIRVGTVQSIPNETNDCAILALVATTGAPYNEARSFVARETGRRPKRGTELASLIRALDSKVVFGKRFESLGDNVTEIRGYSFKVRMTSPSVLTKKAGKIVKSPMTMMKFLKQYSKGTYYVLVKGHALAVVNGVIYGNPQDGKRLKARVIGVFAVK